MARMRNKQKLYNKLNISKSKSDMKISRDNSPEKMNNYSDKQGELNIDLMNVKSTITIPNHLYE
jgi:hypothetical protein